MKIGPGNFDASCSPSGNFTPQTRPGLLVILPTGTSKITAHNTLDRERLRLFYEHGAARQLIAKCTQRLRKLFEVRSDEMVFGEVQFLKPESGDLIQDRALIRNRIRQNDVEGGKTIADDEEQGIAEVENFAHFATAQFLNSRKFNFGLAFA